MVSTVLSALQNMHVPSGRPFHGATIAMLFSVPLTVEEVKSSSQPVFLDVPFFVDFGVPFSPCS